MERGKRKEGREAGVNSWFHLGCRYAYIWNAWRETGARSETLPDVPKWSLLAAFNLSNNCGHSEHPLNVCMC